MPPPIDYDQIAAAYARHRQVHPGVFQALVEVVQPSSRVLEVGCGTGNYITALQAQTGCACAGIDPSPEMLAQARTRPQAAQVDLRVGSGEQIDRPPASFDLVFSVDVIHHVRDRPAYYRHAYRVLDSGGRICTATDSEWIIRHRQPLSAYFPDTVAPELARYPRIPALREMMAEAGFDGIAADTVEWSYEIDDIQIYRDKAYSALHLISEEAFRRGIARLESDLARGPIRCTPRYALLWGTKPSSL
jgi:ubiquinone/menaquinone biosynthesis C-methylase UbiE